MSKKKNKKIKSYYDYQFGKKEKKAKKERKSAYDEPTMKTVKPSIKKKDAKAQLKDLQKPIKVSKAFKERRNTCNHAGKLISVQDFKNLTPTWAAYTPMLDQMVETFGEENVMVCQYCFDVVVRPSCTTFAEVKKAIAVLYAASNTAVSSKRLKDKEIERFNKIKDNLGDWNFVVDAIGKLEKKGAISESTDADDASSMTEEQLANLSKGVNMGTTY